MDREDKFPDLFPDLIYTLLLQLSSSRGPEAASPILKTWRLIHTGTLPEEINLQRHGVGGWQRGAGVRQWVWAGQGLGLPLRSHWTPKSRRHERASSSPPGGEEKFPEADRSHSQLPSPVSSTARCSEFADPLPHVIAPSPVGLGPQA